MVPLLVEQDEGVTCVVGPISVNVVESILMLVNLGPQLIDIPPGQLPVSDPWLPSRLSFGDDVFKSLFQTQVDHPHRFGLVHHHDLKRDRLVELSHGKEFAERVLGNAVTNGLLGFDIIVD